MTSIAIDRTDGLSSSVAIKGPCRVATTANITLSGVQTIDGVAVVADDRVLVKNQTTASENGIYVVDTGAWRRAKDFSGNRDVKLGTQVYITSGALYASSGWYVSTANPIVIDTTSITFTQNVLLNAAQLIALEAAAQAAADAAEAAQAAAEAAQAAVEGSVPNVFATSLAALKALDTTTVFNVWYRGGQWSQFDAADYTAEIAADTVGAIFAQSTDDSDIVWVREGGYYALGRAHFGWFSVPADGTNATTALQTMLTICAALGITRLEAAEKGTYALEAADFPVASFDIEWNNSLIQATYTAGFEGTHPILAANVQTNVSGTSIGDLTGGGGLAAVFDGDNSKTYAQCATVAATTGYVGKTPASAVKVSRAIVYGSSDKGFVTGASPAVTLSLYGKTGAAPANGTDGTLLGSVSFIDVQQSLTYMTEVGDFTAAEVITGGTSGATATLTNIVQLTDDGPEVAGTGFLYVGEITNGPFVVGETVTGGTSGATAVIRTIQTPRRVIKSFDTTRAWDHVWVYKSSTTASTGIAMVEIHEAAEHELVFRNVRVNGGWTSGDATATTSTDDIMLVQGYREFRLEKLYVTACTWGHPSQPTVILERTTGILASRNNNLTTVNGYTAETNKGTEGFLILSDDATHIANLSNIICLDQITGGSSLSVHNLAEVHWRDSFLSGLAGGPNMLAQVIHIDNVHFADITDKALDCTEAIYTPRLVTVENCTFTDIEDGALILGGVATARNNHFEKCGVPIQASGALNTGSLESTSGAEDSAWGEWLAQNERPLSATLINNTFGNASLTTQPNIQIIGTTNNPATVFIRGADRSQSTKTQPNSSVQLRSVRRAEFSGTFYDGSEAIIDYDGGAGAVFVLEADFHPQSGAHTMVLDRASSTLVTPTATIYWKAGCKRHGTLDASHYDFSLDGVNPGTYTAFYIEGANLPTLDTAIAATVPVWRDGRWYETIATDVNFSLTPGTSGTEIRHTGTLTADRSVSLATATATPGYRFRVTRTGAGAFNLNVGTGPLKALVTDTWCEVTYDGSAWYLSAYGAL